MTNDAKKTQIPKQFLVIVGNKDEQAREMLTEMQKKKIVRQTPEFSDKTMRGRFWSSSAHFFTDWKKETFSKRQKEIVQKVEDKAKEFPSTKRNYQSIWFRSIGILL